MASGPDRFGLRASLWVSSTSGIGDKQALRLGLGLQFAGVGSARGRFGIGNCWMGGLGRSRKVFLGAGVDRFTSHWAITDIEGFGTGWMG